MGHSHEEGPSGTLGGPAGADACATGGGAKEHRIYVLLFEYGGGTWRSTVYGQLSLRKAGTQELALDRMTGLTGWGSNFWFESL